MWIYIILIVFILSAIWWFVSKKKSSYWYIKFFFKTYVEKKKINALDDYLLNEEQICEALIRESLLSTYSINNNVFRNSKIEFFIDMLKESWNITELKTVVYLIVTSFLYQYEFELTKSEASFEWDFISYNEYKDTEEEKIEKKKIILKDCINKLYKETIEKYNNNVGKIK